MPNKMSNPTYTQSETERNREQEIKRDAERTATALSTSETVSRYGSANAEYIKGYTGIDHETGKSFAKSLKGIAQGRIHPDYAEQNIKQQAGYAAEVATTSRENAEAIIQKSNVRTSRSDDLDLYGRNHNSVDRVKILDGKIIEGSQSQMKFVGDRNALFKKIAEDTQKGEAEFARYRGLKLELPSEQCKDAADYCHNKARELREKAQKAAQKGAPKDVVERLQKNAENYEQLAENIVDSGLTTEDAIFYRKHPKIATARDIARTSHRAGVEGAKYAAIIGASISLLTNAFSVAQEKKQLDEAARDLAIDTAKATALGYSTAFAGSALKGVMQQSPNSYLRTLANTNAPALAVNICLSLGSSVKRFITGEISEAQLLSEVGEKGAGMLSSSMMAALGQIAIPIPFVGAAVGGMIGYTLSSMFYQHALEAAHGVELSREQLARVRIVEAAARERIALEKGQLDDFISREIPQLKQETEEILQSLDQTAQCNIDSFAHKLNSFAELLGKKLEFRSRAEFNDFMDSEIPLTI